MSLELWKSPLFGATVRDGELYARGSADDEGQVFMDFKAIEAHLKQNGRLPGNMKIILETEPAWWRSSISPMSDRGIPAIR